ncbi:MAG: glutathione S-transferase family protein [Paracoccaceae bacterium]
MTLTYAPGTISIAIAIALEEAGVTYEAQKIDFANAEQTKPAYHQINPKGRVPALITDQGILTETGALLDYVATIAPDAGLVPADPYLAGRMREAMYYLASTMHVNHAHKMRGHRWANDETSWVDMRAKVPETMTASAEYVENHILLDGPFVCGADVSLADAYLYVVARWLPGDGVDLAPFPKLRAFMAAMEDRASVQTVTQQGMFG